MLIQPLVRMKVFLQAIKTPLNLWQAGSVLSDKCDDGSDDGKLSVGSAICAFGKGILKSAFNTVKDILTDPKNFL